MLTTTMAMPPLVESLVAQMFRSIEQDPRYLLMEDGGPVGRKAHVVIARLYGHDEQIEREVRIDQALPVLLVAASDSPPLPASMDSDPSGPSFRATEYVLQSGFSTGGLAAPVADAETTRWIGKDPDPTSFIWEFLGLRYRRRGTTR